MTYVNDNAVVVQAYIESSVHRRKLTRLAIAAKRALQQCAMTLCPDSKQVSGGGRKAPKAEYNHVWNKSIGNSCVK
uniref:AlNc14C283G10138 protein n=1 Tax=Albugo laibachii Nc14 TaxID=890382 RepID=F0WUZ1_9STRA|nr:AlNc14C283G10138 [Albugo laibachii Nc14]|eukprot:CCA25227.1 AlNc14C283G10138 [Albugo laibachii Nc14]